MFFKRQLDTGRSRKILYGTERGEGFRSPIFAGRSTLAHRTADQDVRHSKRCDPRGPGHRAPPSRSIASLAQAQVLQSQAKALTDPLMSVNFATANTND